MLSQLSISTNILPSPDSVKAELAVSSNEQAFIAKARNEIAAILNGEDQRLLLIVGPCSIHDTESALEYAHKLQHLSENISDRFFVIMRTYFDKARSTVGWQGYASDPFINGSDDFEAGISLTRNLLLNLAKLKIPTGAELLNPISIQYFNDLLAWGCIGARTTESQTHRQIASSLSLPVAFKNNTSGNIEAAVNGAFAASSSHNFMGINSAGQLCTIQSKGNQNAHIVLRGSDDSTNYDPISIQHALKSLKTAELPERLLIDCSHGNSNRQHDKQPNVFRSVIQQVLTGNHAIKGLCLESHLKAGNQPIPDSIANLKYGISITDACLGWEETEHLIYSSYRELSEKA